MAWPSIKAPSRIAARYRKAQHRSTFETGRVVTGAKHTIGLRAWKLQWASLSQADLNSLISAFNTDQGGTFSWTHPETSTAYTVGYACDEVKYNLSGSMPGYYEVEVDIEQRS